MTKELNVIFYTINLLKSKFSTKEHHILATHKSAIKRHRQSLERRKRNRASKSRLKTSVKTLKETLETKDRGKIQQNLSKTTSIIAKTATKGITPKNTAARKISRLAKKANAALQANG